MFEGHVGSRMELRWIRVGVGEDWLLGESMEFVTLWSYSNGHIDVMITEDLRGRVGDAPVFMEHRKRTGEMNLSNCYNNAMIVLWLVIGDFNEILFLFEKKGGLLRSDKQMRAFSAALENCALEDLGYEGAWYTWEWGWLA